MASFIGLESLFACRSIPVLKGLYTPRDLHINLESFITLHAEPELHQPRTIVEYSIVLTKDRRTLIVFVAMKYLMKEESPTGEIRRLN
jgi:hypothetical protein